MTMTPVMFRRRRGVRIDHPVELRFVDMLLIIIATLMIITVVLSVVSATTGGGRVDAAPQVTTRSAPTAIAGQPYELTLAVKGGDGQYQWETVDGRLPDGLTLTPGGVVQGTPSDAENTQAVVRVRDGEERASERDLTFTVQPSGKGAETKPKPTITTEVSVLDAVAGQPYRHNFDVEQATSPHQWHHDGRLPEGLELAPDGALGGRPDAGTSTFTVTVTDADGTSVEQDVRLVVREAPESWIWQALKVVVEILKWLGIAVILFFIAVPLWEHLFGREGRTFYVEPKAGRFRRKDGL